MKKITNRKKSEYKEADVSLNAFCVAPEGTVAFQVAQTIQSLIEVGDIIGLTLFEEDVRKLIKYANNR